jgi:predicted MFS family arabinose efflux permease
MRGVSDTPPLDRVALAERRMPLLRQPAFVWLLLTAFVSNVGSWMQAFAEQWVVVQLAGAEAPRWAGRMGFAAGIAMLLLAPFGGALGDRFDRRHLLALSQAWLAALALALGVLALQPDGLTLGRLVAFAAATGVGLALMSPVLSSLFPSVVTHAELASASGYMSGQFNLSRILGPALAAIVLSTVGTAANFFVNAVSYLGLIIVAFRLPAPPRRQTGTPPSSYAHALRQCRTDRALQVAMALSLAAGALAWSYHTFVTVYAVRYLRLEAQGAATLLAAYGIGALVGSVYLSRDAGGPVWRPLRGFMAAYGVGLVAIGLIPYYAFVLGAAAVLGASHAVFGSLLSVVIQRRAPEAMRGRISALYVMAILGTTPLANLVAGEVAQWLGFHGVRWVLALQGLGLVGAAAWAASRAP